MPNQIIMGDCLEVMSAMEPASVDLVFTSSPYESARTYGVGFNLKGQEFVDWCVERYLACLRVSRGLVAWVIEGQTRQFRWSAVPALLMADLHRRGVHLRNPPIFQRVGIPGSGGPDWLRNDKEFIVCATNGGKLPWSDNTACGHTPKWAPGGEMSNRTTDGARVNSTKKKKGKNQWGHSLESGATVVLEGGQVRSDGKRPSHRDAYGFTPHGGEPSPTQRANGFRRKGGRRIVTKQKDGMHAGQENFSYAEPVKANPGNVIEQTYTFTASELAALLAEGGDVTRHIVGGGVMGSKLCHENEAPFCESLCEFFIRSFCPPGGIVLDPFSGSGTTIAVAERLGRNWLGIDCRESQVELSWRRIEEVRNERARA